MLGSAPVSLRRLASRRGLAATSSSSSRLAPVVAPISSCVASASAAASLGSRGFHAVSSSTATAAAVAMPAPKGSRSLHASSLRSAAVPPHTKMAMPALSPTMTTGTIIAWRKKPGDALNPGDSIAEVGTDKATVDFEVQDSGYLAKILVPDGATEVKVGSVIAIMVDSAEAVAAFASIPAEALTEGAAPAAPAAAPAAPASPQPKPAPAPVAAPSSSSSSSSAAAAPSSGASSNNGGKVVASPLAKKLAADAGFSASALSSLQGTGPNGRVIAADVKEAIAEGRLGATAAASTGAAAPAAAAAAPAVSAASVSAAAASAAPGRFVDVPHSQMRRVIAQRLTMSKQTVPHYTLTSEINLDALLTLRSTLNNELSSGGKDKDGGVKLSVNDFIIKASALACRKVPEMNSSWLEHGIRSYHYVDVSVAVALPDGGGLITPIVADADTKGLLTIANNVRSLVEKARTKSLLPHEYQGGTFTVSNLGMFGVKTFSAIINPPQAGILAIGAAEKRVLPAAPGSEQPFKQSVVMNATLSCDHRVVDGAVGAQWLAAFKGFLEQPHTMLL